MRDLAGSIDFDERLRWLTRVLTSRDYPIENLADNLRAGEWVSRDNRPRERPRARGAARRRSRVRSAPERTRSSVPGRGRRRSPVARVRCIQVQQECPTALSDLELSQLLAHPDLRATIGVRDRAILELLARAGLRR